MTPTAAGSATDFPRRGVTFVDPISVVAVMTLLGVLLFPAVQQAREDGRQARCKMNLKTIGLSVYNYHDTFSVFPPAVFTAGDTASIEDYQGPTTAAELAASSGGFADTWAVAVLPWLDGREFWHKVDWTVRFEDQPKLTSLPIETFVCPAAGDPTLTIGTEAADTPPPGSVYARSNYGLNLGGGNVNPIGSDTPDAQNGPYAQSDLNGTLETPTANRGMGTSPQSRTQLNSRQFSEGEIFDGMSNTILVGELLTDSQDSADSRGAWARGMGAIVSAYTRGKPADGPGGIATPNAPTIDRTDPAGPKLSIYADCPVFAASREGELVEQISATPCPGFDENAGGGVAIRSRHPGRATAVLGDGRVRTLTESIDSLLFRSIMTSRGKEVIPDSF